MNPVNEHGDMIAISAYRKREADLYDQIYDLQFENAGLRVELEKQAVCNGKGSEREAALLGKVEQLTRKKAIQGLHLATMADAVLGENAEDRSDETLVREVCRIAREHSARKEQPYDTPRTDAKAQFFGFNPDEGEEFVQADFARELERENAALRADKERLDWLAVSDEWFDVPAAESFAADTFRAAIDAARKEQP